MIDQKNIKKDKNTHAVTIRNNKQIFLRETYPTYGAAMRAIVEFEKIHPDCIIEYRDIR
jgi:hypothetical protein